MLRQHKFVVHRHEVLEAVRKPERVDYSRLPLIIAQRHFDKTHVLRVVYKRVGETIRVITFYPGRKLQYEEDKE